MSCNCTPPDRTSLWTPIPAFSEPTEIIQGENLDCFARRAGDPTGLKDDARQDVTNKIQNNYIRAVPNAQGTYDVNETLTLSPGPRAATGWGVSGTNLLSVGALGNLSGTLPEGTYKIVISALDSIGTIDSREYTVVAAPVKKGESISLIIPYKSTNGFTPRVNSGFGPRMHPILHVMKMHTGQDWVGGGQGEILAAADGEVVFAGVDGGYGNHICINHLATDGSVICQTTYSHCKQILVTRGQKVGAGQVIALEGSTGASTGPHLHFEVRLGTTPVDPAPYINGTFQVTAPTPVDNSQPATTTVSNTTAAVTKAESTARDGVDCPKIIRDPATPTTPEPTTAPTPGPSFNNQAPTTGSCTPAVRPTYAQVSAAIDAVLNADPTLTDEDKKLIRFIAQIESRYDPYAKNPTSSALGLYQFLDNLAVKYYGIIGIPPTCANRCNPTYATQAMVQFYKRELLNYWTGYNNSGKTRIANLNIRLTPHSETYPTLNQGEFCYGLIHHDGVGNAVNGIDMGGVDYYRKKIRETGFA